MAAEEGEHGFHSTMCLSFGGSEPSLAKIELMCFSTADWDTKSPSPIAAFDLPSAIALKTSVSRGVSVSSRRLASQLRWAPTEIALRSGRSGLWVDNRDGVRHAFVVPEPGIELGAAIKGVPIQRSGWPDE